MCLQIALRTSESLATTSHFYVTLFSNAARDIYEQNTHADFTVKLAQPVDLGSNSNWVVGLCEISYSSPPMGEEETTALMYCNLISLQFVGDSTVRCTRTFVFQSLTCQREFQNVYYVLVEKRIFQDIRIDLLTTEGLHAPFEDSTTPTKVVIHFRKNDKW